MERYTRRFNELRTQNVMIFFDYFFLLSVRQWREFIVYGKPLKGTRGITRICAF